MKRHYTILTAGLALLLGACTAQDHFTATEKAIISAPAPEGRTDYEGKILRLWKIDTHEDSLLLRAEAKPVSREMLATQEFRQLHERMLATVQDSLDEGVGLAAPQVGISRQLFIVQRWDKPGHPFETFLNPEMLEKSDSLIQGVEGCLSVPDLWGNVGRANEIRLRYRNLDFEEVTETVSGFTAVIFQHEMDHLDGGLYIDRMDRPQAYDLGEEYRLKKVIPVRGRQGIAIDELFYYVSDTRALYKYDKEGNLMGMNLQPFQHPERANHFGDIDIYKGELYCGLEKFEYGRGYNIAVSVYDAETLQWKRDLPWSPESGQVEVSGLAVDRERGLVWMCDWVDSRYVYAYDLETGRYHTKMQCHPVPWWTQGIFVADGRMLFAADDGDAMYGIPDSIYQVELEEVPYTGLVEGREVVRESPFAVLLDESGKPVMREGLIAGGALSGRVSLFREMKDFRRAGEIEGLSIDPCTQDLVVLNNRGTSIVLGMSQGPIVSEGYSREIHELYIYEKVK